MVNNNGGQLAADNFPRFIDGTPVAWNTPVTLDAGPHTASETPQTGYTASAWGGDCAAGGTITLAPGDNKTCTITNDDQAATLQLVKSVNNANHPFGGGAAAADWTLSAAGPTPLSGAGGVASTPVSAGTYTLSEQVTAGSEAITNGYLASAWVCAGGTQDGSQVTLANGQSAVCTITNADQPAEMPLNKLINSSPAPSGVNDPKYAIALYSTPTFGTDYPNTTFGGLPFLAIPPETTLPIPFLGAPLTICELGIAGNIVPGPVGTPFEGMFLAGSYTPFSAFWQTSITVHITSDGGTFGDLDAGNIGPQTSPQTGVSCRSFTVPVTATGGTLSIEFNNIPPAQIIINKTATGGNGTFGFGVTGPSASSRNVNATTPDNGNFIGSITFEVLPGTGYSVVENAYPNGTVAADWTTTSPANCVDAAVASGQTLTCNFTNVKRPKLTVNKVLQPVGAGTFNLQINGTTHATGIGNGGTTNAQYANIGSNTFGETGDTANLSDYEITISGTGCVADSAGSSTGTISLAAGDNLTCTITNKKKSSITIIKDATPQENTFNFTSTGGAPLLASFPLTGSTAGGGNQVSYTGLTTFGTQYSVTEVVDINWALTSFGCVDGANGNAVVGTKNGSTATFTLQPGMNVVCTFVNKKKGHLIIRKVTDPPSDTTTLFGFQTNAGPNFSLTGGGSQDFFVAPDTYHVTETNIPNGWGVSNIVCTLPDGTSVGEKVTGAGGQTNQDPAFNSGDYRVQNIVLGPGQTITCTFTNTLNQARMTGGGSIFNGDSRTSPRVTHGFELHCDPSVLPNNLEINWPSTDGRRQNQFHLEMLNTAVCTDNPSIVPKPPKATTLDTYTGTGTGRYNGTSGYQAQWVFTDAGEPGTSDAAWIKITDPSGITTVLEVFGNLSRGNQQMHQ